MFLFRYIEQAANVSTGKGIQMLTIAGFIIALYVALLLHIIIHEAGHLVFGLKSGYKFSSFRILSVMWMKKDGKITRKKLSIAGTAGQCLMAPPDLVDGKMPVLLYNYGGSIMNVIASVVFFVIALFLKPYSIPWILLMATAVIGIIFAAMNGIPLKMGGVNNDGKNAQDLTNNEEAMRAFWIQMKANEMITKGVRLKDMPAEWFELPSDESMKNGIIATVGVLACNRLMDEHRFAEADELIIKLLSMETGIVGLYRTLMLMDRIYIELISQNRSSVIRSIRSRLNDKIMKSMKDYPTILRTEYVNALLGDNYEEDPRDILARFEKNSANFPYPSEIEAERELIAIAQARGGQE